MAVSKRRQFSAEKGICHMSEDTITKLPDPSGNSPDPLADVIRGGISPSDASGGAGCKQPESSPAKLPNARSIKRRGGFAAA
jgi:hypothetical protein